MKKTHVVLVDDLDGSPAAETLTFAFKGVTYEIDLSEKNAEKFENDLAKWIKAGRKIAGRRIRSSRSGVSAVTASRAAEIREWARGEGIEVSERGRIPADVVAKFDARR